MVNLFFSYLHGAVLSVKSEVKDSICQVFKNSKHRWRSARSISKDSDISLSQVTKFLEHSPLVIHSAKSDSYGQALYALKNKRYLTVENENNDTTQFTDTIEETKYFILIPIDFSMKQLRDTISRSIREAQGSPVFVDELPNGAAWIDEISRNIRRCDVIIADITRMSHNIMFELGIAHGSGKPIILLLSEDAGIDIPTSLVGYQYITYNPANLTIFTERFRRVSHQLEARRKGGEL